MKKLPNESEWIDIRCEEDGSLMLRVTKDTIGFVECKCRKCRKIMPIPLPYIPPSKT